MKVICIKILNPTLSLLPGEQQRAALSSALAVAAEEAQRAANAAATPRRTEDGRYAYVFGIKARKVILKTGRPLSETERSGMLDRLKIKRLGSWQASCDGTLDDGAPYRSEMLVESQLPTEADAALGSSRPGCRRSRHARLS